MEGLDDGVDGLESLVGAEGGGAAGSPDRTPDASPVPSPDASPRSGSRLPRIFRSRSRRTADTIHTLVGMGFEQHQAEAAVRHVGPDTSRAVDFILGGGEVLQKRSRSRQKGRMMRRAAAGRRVAAGGVQNQMYSATA